MKEETDQIWAKIANDAPYVQHELLTRLVHVIEKDQGERMIRPLTVRLALFSICYLALGACASVAPLPASPFQQFHASVVQLGASADQALAVEQELAYWRYIESFAPSGEFGQLKLLDDPDVSVFEMKVADVPLFQEIQTTRSNLASLHSLLEEYAALLLVLAGATDTSQSIDAVAVATELRTNATSLAASLNANPDLDNDWFFGFGVLAQEYVESKRRDTLTRLLRSADDEMRAFAVLGQQISLLSAAGIQAEYNTSFSAQTQGANEVGAVQRQEVVVDVLELNAQTLRQLESLKQLHDAYGALPGAHLQLQSAVTSGTAPAVSALLSYAEALRDKYKSFNKE